MLVIILARQPYSVLCFINWHPTKHEKTQNQYSFDNTKLDKYFFYCN